MVMGGNCIIEYNLRHVIQNTAHRAAVFCILENRLLFRVTFSLIWIKESLAKSERLWRHFEQFVVFDEVDTLLEA